MLKMTLNDVAVHGTSPSYGWSVTCHMGSHSVTCHPTQVPLSPRINPRQTGRCSIYLPPRDGRL